MTATAIRALSAQLRANLELADCARRLDRYEEETHWLNMAYETWRALTDAGVVVWPSMEENYGS